MGSYTSRSHGGEASGADAKEGREGSSAGAPQVQRSEAVVQAPARDAAPAPAGVEPPPARQRSSRRPGERRSTRPPPPAQGSTAPKQRASRAPPGHRPSRPPTRSGEHRSKQPPSLEPLELSESFFPTPDEAHADGVGGARVPPLPPPPAGLAASPPAPPAPVAVPRPAAPAPAAAPVPVRPAPPVAPAPWRDAARAVSSPSLEIGAEPVASAGARGAAASPLAELSDDELEEELSLLMGAEPAAARPPPDALADDGPPSSDLADELDACFAAARQPSSLPSAAPPSSPDVVTTSSDLEGIRELFSEMAGSYTRPVRDFVEELSHADASKSWLEACAPALEALRATSRQLGMVELGAALDSCLEAFATVRASAGERIAGAERAELLARFARLTAVLPAAFEVGGSREPLLVQLLLLQVPGVHKRTVEKLARAGVTRLDALLRGEPEEIAAVAGIELELARRITERFREYAGRVRSMLAQLEPREEHAALLGLVARLRTEDDAFERASAGWSKKHVEDKRRLRGERSATLKEIYVVLVRLGEVERVEALQKLPVRRQLEELERFANESASRTRSLRPFA